MTHHELMRSQPWHSIVILEQEELEESDFCIGRFIDCEDRKIRLHEFSGAGNWDEELTEICSDDVTCCQLNTNYIRFYADYFASHNPPRIGPITN